MALSPAFVAGVCFYALVLATRLRLGQWPRYHHPDAGVWSELPYPYAHTVVFVLLACAVFSGPLFVLGAFVGRLRQWPGVFRYCVSALVALLVFLVLSRFDPGGFFAWFFD